MIKIKIGLIIIRLIFAALVLSGPAWAQGAQAYTENVNKTILQLPSIWQTEIADSIAQTWSSSTLVCVREVKIVVSEREDPLAVKYNEGQISMSRGYVEMLGQATLFTFLTTLGIFPRENISGVLDQHEAILAERRRDNISYFELRSGKPPLILDDAYARPYLGRLSETFSRIGLPEVEHVADMLNGAVLIFALLHEAGHYVYRNCPKTVPIDAGIAEEIWADRFAIEPFRNEGFPTLLATDAIRILSAYLGSETETASLQCRLKLIVDELEFPNYQVFTKEGFHFANAQTFAANLAVLLPIYQARYSKMKC